MEFIQFIYRELDECQNLEDFYDDPLQDIDNSSVTYTAGQ